jgi:hypothetical protein
MSPAEPDQTSELLGEVASTLWQLRELLDTLLFKLAVTRLVLASGQNQWLANATRDLDSALHEVHSAEVLRATRTDALARRLALSAGTTLARLADAAPQPWTTLLHEHRDALRTLLTNVDTAGKDRPPPPTGEPHDPGGALDDDIVRPVALHTMARVRLSSLKVFLR